MPHQVIEYSNNLSDHVDVAELVGTMHEVAAGVEAFPLGGLRTRAVSREHYRIADGQEIWRTDRDEVPTWGTPTVDVTRGTGQVILNGYRHIGAYALEDGQPLWWLKGGGDIPVPTPVVSDGLVFITNSHGRMRPIYAIRLDRSLSPRQVLLEKPGKSWSQERGLNDLQYIVPGGGGFGELMNNAVE